MWHTTCAVVGWLVGWVGGGWVSYCSVGGWVGVRCKAVLMWRTTCVLTPGGPGGWLVGWLVSGGAVQARTHVAHDCVRFGRSWWREARRRLEEGREDGREGSVRACVCACVCEFVVGGWVSGRVGGAIRLVRHEAGVIPRGGCGTRTRLDPGGHTP
jgi:hypothetical protein